MYSTFNLLYKKCSPGEVFHTVARDSDFGECHIVCNLWYYMWVTRGSFSTVTATSPNLTLSCIRRYFCFTSKLSDHKRQKRPPITSELLPPIISPMHWAIANNGNFLTLCWLGNFVQSCKFTMARHQCDYFDDGWRHNTAKLVGLMSKTTN
jgi:hypothetical protein